MEYKVKLFANGRSQAVRLPAQFRFDSTEVFIRQDPVTHDVILSRRPATWEGFFQALKNSWCGGHALGRAGLHEGGGRCAAQRLAPVRLKAQPGAPLGVALAVVLGVLLERHAALAPGVNLLQAALDALAVSGFGLHLASPRC